MPSRTSNNPNPVEGAAAVTVSDSTDLTLAPCRALWIGAAGNVSVVMADDTTITFTGVNAGTLLPISVKRVRSTGTTVSTPNTNIVALY